jgi:hypothetical protein
VDSLPLVVHRDDTGLVDGDGRPRGLRHVEVAERRVAPASIVAGERVVGWAVVGGRDGDGRTGLAPLGLAGVADDAVARAAQRAVVEKCRAQRSIVHPVPRAVEVAVPTRAACTHSSVTLLVTSNHRYKSGRNNKKVHRK